MTSFMTRGIHALKFGLTLERTQTNTGGPGDLPRLVTFSNYPNFLTVSPSSLIANSGREIFRPTTASGSGARTCKMIYV